MHRKTSEDEEAFRKEQKISEVRAILLNAPSTVDDFVRCATWSRNKSQNLVFEHLVTIFSQNGKFNWCIAGGKPSYGIGGFATEEAAQRNVWEYMQKVLE